MKQNDERKYGDGSLFVQGLLEEARVRALVVALKGVTFEDDCVVFRGVKMGLFDRQFDLASTIEVMDWLVDRGLSVDHAVDLIQLRRCGQNNLEAVVHVLESVVNAEVVDIGDMCDVASVVSFDSTDTVGSERSLRKKVRRDKYLQIAEQQVDSLGYCYLGLFGKSYRVSMAARLGSMPSLALVLSQPAHMYDLSGWADLQLSGYEGGYHVEPGAGMLSVVLTTLLAIPYHNESLRFRMMLEFPELALGSTVLDLRKVCGARTPLSPVTEVHGDESLYDVMASAEHIDVALLDTTDYDDYPLLNLEVYRHGVEQVLPAGKQIEVKESQVCTLHTGAQYTFTSVGLASVAVLHVPAGAKLQVAERVIADDRDAMVWVKHGTHASFRVTGVGRNRVAVHYFPPDMIAHPIKDRLWSKLHGICVLLHIRGSLPKDVASIVGVATDSTVQQSLIKQSGLSIDYDGVIMVRNTRLVDAVRGWFPKARIRCVSLVLAQQFSHAVVLPLPDEVDGDAFWFKNVHSYESARCLDGVRLYPQWTPTMLRLAMTRHTHELRFVDVDFNPEFVGLMQLHGLQCLFVE